MDITDEPSRNGGDTSRSKVNIFSLTQSRALLETRRSKTGEILISKPSILPPAPHNKFISAMRQPLTPLLGNVARMSTPVQQRAAMYHEEDHGGSSPSMSLSVSPQGAYMRSNLSSSAVPQVQGTPRQHPSRASSHTPLRAPETPARRISAEGPEAQSMESQFVTALIHNRALTSEKEHLNLIYAQVSHELRDYRSRFESTSSELQSRNAELAQLRNDLSSAQGDISARDNDINFLKSEVSDVSSQLSTSVDENSHLRRELSDQSNEGDKLRKLAENAKIGIARVTDAYTELGASYRELKKEFDVAQLKWKSMAQEADDFKRLAKNGLSALKPMLDDNNTLSRAAETKAVLKDLQDDLSNSHQVTDLLRHKLLHNVSQLAEAQGRVRELEQEQRTWNGNLMDAREDETRHFEKLGDIQAKFDKLSERLVKRERETMDLLENSVLTESYLKSTTTELETCKNTCRDHVNELDAARAMKEENVSKLLALQDTINSRDREVASLKAGLKSAGESKADLHALFAEAKKSLADKEVELRERDPNVEFQREIEQLTQRTAELTLSLDENQEKVFSLERALHQIEKENTRLMTLNNKLEGDFADIQDALRTSLSKEMKVDAKYQLLQESLEENQERLCSSQTALHQAEKENVKLMTLNSKLEDESSDIKARLEIQSVTLFQTKEECARLKSRVEQQDRLIKSAENTASVAEKSTSFAHIQFESAKRKISELEGAMAKLESNLTTTKEKLVLARSSATLQSDERVTKLQEKVTFLSQLNAEAEERAGSLVTRYSDGDLTDVERELISYLMDEAQNIHEQETVTKDNELRRKNQMIEGLNAKVTDLHESIKRLVSEKEKAAAGHAAPGKRSLVNMKALFPSTPTAADGVQVDGNGNGPTASPPAVTRAVNRVFNAMDEDSEEDIPLSELSRLHESGDDEEGQVGQKRTRAQSPPAPGTGEPSRTRRRTKNPAVPKPVAPAGTPSSGLQPKTGKTLAKTKQKKRQ